MMPDFIISDQTGMVVCVAEIGYTNPDKLRAYRDAYKFADVRWYDKHGELYNTTDKETREEMILLKDDVRAIMDVMAKKLLPPNPPPVPEDIQFELCVHKETGGAFHCQFLHRCTERGCPNYAHFGGLEASMRTMTSRATGTDYSPIARFEEENRRDE
jgi:hypothetical protein